MHETNYEEGNVANPGYQSAQNYSYKVNPRLVLVSSTIVCLTVILCGITTALLVTGIKSHQKPLECFEAACPENWIGFQRKCFYFSDDIMNWTFSKTFCESQDADLVHVEILQELNFLLRYKDSSDHWIGLSREQGQPWKWTNGTEWTASFPIKGNGDYAYLNDKGASSGRRYTEKKWICSKPHTCAQMKTQSPS